MSRTGRFAQVLAGQRTEFSTRITFFLCGLGTAAWAPLVPYARARAGLDDGTLGLLLLALGGGSILSMPLAGLLTGRHGCRAVVAGSVILMCAALPVLAGASSLPLLAAALALFGAGLGALDVSMNIQAIQVERRGGRIMMSGFHGLFSLGCIAGAAGTAGLLAAGASPLLGTLCFCAVILAGLALAAPHLLTDKAAAGRVFALPRGSVLFIGALCFIAFLAEGAMLDWSAVYLTTVVGGAAAHAGLGYAAFSVTMTVGRLTGDRLVRRFGPAAVVAGGGLCAAGGLVLAALLPNWPATLAGYALVGAGCANVAPILISRAGRLPGVADTVAVPAVTTLGYAGILLGPAAIGLASHLAGLPFAFLLLGGLLLGVFAGGLMMRPQP